MQLAGYDLNDGDVPRMPHLLRREIEGALTWLYICQVDFGMNFVRLQLPDDPFWAPHADLGLLDGLGTDFQLGWNMLKNNGSAQGDFRRLLVARNQKPQARR